MTDDVCLTCQFRDKVACASCWNRLVIHSEKERVDGEASDFELWDTVGVEYEP